MFVILLTFPFTSFLCSTMLDIILNNAIQFMPVKFLGLSLTMISL